MKIQVRYHDTYNPNGPNSAIFTVNDFADMNFSSGDGILIFRTEDFSQILVIRHVDFIDVTRVG